MVHVHAQEVIVKLRGQVSGRDAEMLCQLAAHCTCEVRLYRQTIYGLAPERTARAFPFGE
jgi:hypothetical protein